MNLTKVAVCDSYNMECINVLGAVDTVAGVDSFIANDTEAWGRVFTQDETISNDNDEANYEAVVNMGCQLFITSECYDYQTAIDSAGNRLESKLLYARLTIQRISSII